MSLSDCTSTFTTHTAQDALGARGTAVIVHSLNKLDSLTLDQVKAIFGGRLDDWRLLEASQSNLPIRRYGPGKYDPAANIFYEKVLPWTDCKNVNRKDTAAEIIAAVGADRWRERFSPAGSWRRRTCNRTFLSGPNMRFFGQKSQIPSTL